MVGNIEMSIKKIETLLHKNNSRLVFFFFTIVLLLYVYNGRAIQKTLMLEYEVLREKNKINETRAQVSIKINNHFINNAEILNKNIALFDRHLPKGKMKMVFAIRSDDNMESFTNLNKISVTMELLNDKIETWLFYDKSKKIINAEKFIEVEIKNLNTPTLFVTGGNNEVIYSYTFTGEESVNELFFIRDFLVVLFKEK